MSARYSITLYQANNRSNSVTVDVTARNASEAYHKAVALAPPMAQQQVKYGPISEACKCEPV